MGTKMAAHLAQLVRPVGLAFDIGWEVSGLESCGRGQTLLNLQDRGLLELHDLRDLGLISALVHAHRAVRRGVAAQQRRRV